MAKAGRASGAYGFAGADAAPAPRSGSQGYGFGDDGSDMPKQPSIPERFGDIQLRPYRRKAENRLKEDRINFNGKLLELQKRAVEGFKSGVQIKHLQIGRTLGEGNFGRVLVVSPSAEKCAVDLPKFGALKIQRKKHMAKEKKEIQHVRDEKNLAYAFNCPFLVRIIDYFQDKSSIYFLMELCNAGELWSIIQGSKRTRLDPKVAKFWAAQVALAFEYLHNLDVIFRDLKPENLLVDHRGYLKLTDFGFAKRVTDRAFTMCGTPEYMAPEIILGRGYSHDVDWWAFGILVYEMNHGLPPFVDDNQLRMFKKIQSGTFRFQAHMGKSLQDLVTKFLKADVSVRLSSNKHNGMNTIKSLDYFKGLDWEKLYSCALPSPYKPKIKGPGDCSNFDKYDERPVKWVEGKDDGYGDTFDGF
eukprot:CAMPEP_0182915928 /NCGR_PEP_ID=MMETSP0105_2-20130417/630_1 /TAXON_ID=81532 ORGANISM="Acanthoeca-like sp., Strain 10tr" /NCGR_SAMPLE_ID=MMETSP0105_2 /ASSEMBLY_ACC=CAM_ASM_000205 /LENGTH=414 /DNA_ID=CAMNT_0025052833 /DNA_START=64 /DNA_END=1308 /DNA_ORIENTATION=-